jgi:hypothetical protein
MYAIVFFDHQSECYVSAEKIRTASSLTEAGKVLKEVRKGKRRQDMYDVVNDFEGDSINADYVQPYNFDDDKYFN